MKTELIKFMKILKCNKRNLTCQQFRTIKGQAFAGDIAGAKKRLDAVFDANGTQIYPAAAAKKSVDTIAREVIQGKWGNGADRKQKLTAAGYDYSAVQKRVNELIR